MQSLADKHEKHKDDRDPSLGGGGVSSAIIGAAVVPGVPSGAASVPLEFSHWRYGAEYRQRLALAQHKGDVRDAYVDWLCDQGYQFRIDLTFRVGSRGCDIDGLSPEAATRFLSAWKDRLAAAWGRPVQVFAAMENQRRGVPHWHCLVKTTDGGRPPYMSCRQFRDSWQVWERWPIKWQSRGCQGYLKVTYLNGRRSTRQCVEYVVKYVVKGDGDHLYLADVQAPGGMTPGEVKDRDDRRRWQTAYYARLSGDRKYKTGGAATRIVPAFGSCQVVGHKSVEGVQGVCKSRRAAQACSGSSPERIPSSVQVTPYRRATRSVAADADAAPKGVPRSR